MKNWRQFVKFPGLSRNGALHRIVSKPGLILTQDKMLTEVLIFLYKNVLSLYMFYVVWDSFNSKEKEKQHVKQKTSLKSYNTEIKIFANPGFG